MAVFTMETVSVPYASVIPDGLARIVPSFTATTYTTVLAMASAWVLMSASAFRDIWYVLWSYIHDISLIKLSIIT